MDDRLLLGVEIGGTKLQLGLGLGDCRLIGLERRAIVPASGAAGILAQIGSAVGPLIDRLAPVGRRLGAVGIGFGGPVDASLGVVRRSNQVAGWDGFPLADWFREVLAVEAVALENDADAAALGEARRGAGRGRSPVLYVTVGSGIGGGLVVDGRIYRGMGAGATEIGQLWIEPPSPAEAGRTLEAIASGWSIAASARALAVDRPGRLLALAGGDPARIDAELVALAASEGDPEARAQLERATRALALGLAQAVNLLGPARIILGGGVSLIGETLWLGPVRERLERLVFPPFRGTFDLVPASLGERVVVEGALELARQAIA